MSYAGKSVLVLGFGRSGRAAALLLLSQGARVLAYDRDPKAFEDAPDAVQRLAELPHDFDAFAAVVVSPGFPVAAHPRVLPEVELAAEHIDAPIVGVTGTNGKSTTTVLIGRMLESSGLRTAVGGNLGTAFCALVGLQVDRVVCELSSFQLEHVRKLRAQVAVLLNLAPDHLDRHGSVEAYGAAKQNLVELQQPEDVLVANLDDPWARELASRAHGSVRGFSVSRRLDSGASLDGKDLILIREDKERLRMPIAELSLACRSPLANALAAVLAADAAGATPEGMRAVLTSFEGLPHRAQEVCVRAGVRFVDDSKATNPAAAAASVLACEGPVVWIAGGRNKGLDFSLLRDAARSVQAAVAYGEAGDALEAALSAAPAVLRVDALSDAVREAARHARPGHTVLLAPACSSLDQFRDFEERGNAFARLARELPDSALEGSAC